MSGSASAGQRAFQAEQEYYASRPSAAFMAEQAKYEASKGRITTGGGSYRATGELQLSDPSGDIGVSGRAALQYGKETFISKTPAATPTFYVPYGERTQQELPDAKAVIDPIGGRIGIYQKPASIYESEGGFKRIYGWETASGSTGALQSGMFSIDRPLTADVRTQYSPETYAKTANVGEATKIRAEPEKYSRLGAEAYGGIVSPMDQRTLKPGTQMSRYAPETGNLANLVDPFGVNRPKSELQATEPWKIDWGASPIFQTMSGKGIAGTIVSPMEQTEYSKVGMTPGGATLQAMQKEIAPGVFSTGKIAVMKGSAPAGPEVEIRNQQLPAPFLSETGAVVQPKGEIFGRYIPGASEVVAFFEPQMRVTTKTERTAIPEVTTLKGSTVETTPEGIRETQFFETTGGEKVKTTEKATPIAGSSGYDKFNQYIRDTLHLPSPEVGEKAMEIASAGNPLSPSWFPLKAGREAAFSAAESLGFSAVEQRKSVQVVSDITDPYKGQYTMFYEHPAAVGLSYAAGGLFGTGAKIFEGTTMGLRGAAAEQIISKGGTWRAAEQFSGTVMQYAPRVLEGVYALDIAGRSTKGFTSFDPGETSQRARAITVQETYPMMAGFALPERILGGVGSARIAYKSAQQEIAGERAAAYGEPVSPKEVSFQDVMRYTIGPKVSEMKFAAKETAGKAIEIFAGREPGTTVEYKGYQPITSKVSEVGSKVKSMFDVGPKYPEVQRPTMAPENEFATSAVYEKVPVREQLSGIASSAKAKAENIIAKPKAAYENVRGDYYEYIVRNAPAELTPRQKIDADLLRVQQKTGYLQREQVFAYDTTTGERIFSAKGNIYKEGKWLQSVDITAGDVATAARARGIEPATIIETPTGKKMAYDFSGIEIYHTHPRGVALGKQPGLEVPSGADFESATRVRFGMEGIVTPTGVARYRPEEMPSPEVLGKARTMAGVAYAETGFSEEAVGKVFSRSMAESGTGMYDYRTVAEVRAGIPATGKQPGLAGYIGEKAGAAGERLFGARPRYPEITRPTVAPEEEFSFAYQRTSLAEKHEALVDWMYKPRLSKIIPPSTWGETKPMFAMTAPAAAGEAGRPSTKTGGTPDSGPSKFRKTIVGGRERMGLAKEPSLKSMGIREGPAAGTSPMEGAGRRTGYAQDFRGKPLSEKMKPMRPETYGVKETGAKQAAGGRSALLTEQLPRIEGMPEVAVRGQQQQFRSFGAVFQAQPRGREVVSVTEPELEFSQTTRIRQEQMTMPAVLTARAQAMGSLTEIRTDTRISQEVIQRQRQDVFPVVAVRVAQGQRTGTSQRLDQESSRILDLVRGTDRITDQATRTGSRIVTIPRTTTRTGQRTTTDTRITEVPWDWGWTRDITTDKKITGGYYPPGGGDSGRGVGRSRYAFREEIPLISVLLGSEGSGRRSTSARGQSAVDTNRLFRRTNNPRTRKIGKRYFGKVQDEKTIVTRAKAVFKRTGKIRY
jgi:hypothetical protein